MAKPPSSTVLLPPPTPESQARNYKDVYPLANDLMDLLALDQTLPGQAEQLVLALLKSRGLDQTVSVHGQWARAWQHWSSDNINTMHSAGYRPFGLGFPMIFREEEDGELDASPLFIWPLHIEPDPVRVDYWRLRQMPGYGPIVNPFWLAGLPNEAEEQLAAWQTWQEIHREHDSLSGSITEFCQALKLPLSGSAERLSAVPVPGSEDFENPEPGLRLSGFLGLFPPPVPFSSENALEGLLPIEKQGEPVHSFGLHNPDPVAALAKRMLYSQRTCLLEGTADGSLSELLFDKVVHGLADGHTCLIVSPDPKRLRYRHDQFGSAGLESLVFLGNDPVTDTLGLNKRLKALLEGHSPKKEIVWPVDELLEGCHEKLEPLENAREALVRPVFGPKTWQEVVAMLSQAHLEDGSAKISPSVAPGALRLTWEEYNNLREVMDRGGKLFGPVGVFDHPLTKLNSELFLDYDLVACEDILRTRLLDKLRVFRTLQQDLEKIRGDYAKALDDHYSSWYRSLALPLFDLKELIDKYIDEYGNNFSLSSLFTLRLFGLFSKKFKHLYEVKTQVFEAYEGLSFRYKEFGYFPYEFPQYGRGNDLPKLRASLADFTQALGFWNESLPPRMEEAVRRLSSWNIHSEVDMSERIAAFEEQYGSEVADLNELKLFPQPFQSDLSQTEDQLKALEKVVNRLEEVTFALDPFEDFYKWHRFWLTREQPARQLMKAVIESSSANWPASFDIWYLDQVTSQQENAKLPRPGWSAKDFSEHLDKWRDNLPGYILEYWQARRHEKLESLHPDKPGTPSRLVGLLRGRKQDTNNPEPTDVLPLKDILDLIPVWILSPSSAACLFHGEDAEEAFHTVVLDDTQSFPAGNGRYILPLGIQKVLLSRYAPGPVSDFQTVRDLALESECPNVILPKEIVSEDDKKEHPIPELIEVEGIYDPKRGSNEAEIDALLKFLAGLPHRSEKANNICILAWRPEQRDRILTRLRVVTERGLPEAAAIQSLTARGLHVFHLGERPLSEVSHLILSTTFGPEEEEGHLTDDIQSLDQEVWQELQRAWLDMDAGQISILSSIPDSWDPKGRAGQRTLADLLVLARNPPNSDDGVSGEGAKDKNKTLEIPAFPNNAFGKTVLDQLYPLLESGSGWTMKPDTLPILVKQKDDPEAKPCLLLVDGVLAPISDTDFAWEHQKQMELEKAGFRLIPVWSATFWRDPEAAAKRIANSIDR